MEISHEVTVKLLFFAQSKDLSGTREATLTLPRKLSYQQLLDIIIEKYNLGAIKNTILLAKNEEVCDEYRDIEINERDCIAVIPPLSGKDNFSYSRVTNQAVEMDHLKLTNDVLSVEAISELVMDDTCGAVSMFVGTTRDSFEGKTVVRLEYESYEAMALKAMKQICEDIRKQWPAVHGIAIYHRLGSVPTREASVVIAISSPHRRESLEAVSACIDALKGSVPIWKREVYADAEAAWKENQECPQRAKPTPDLPKHAPIEVDKNLVQINVSPEELEQRIQNFIATKRDQVNLSNIHDFMPGRGDEEDTCARVRAQFVRRSDSKGHLKVRKVSHAWGPQTVPTQELVKPKQEPGLPPALAERVVGIEGYLHMGQGPVPPDIYRRLKAMEDRIAELQAVSPEYAHFWRNNNAEDIKQETMDYQFSADDIARKIEQLERQGPRS